jgi:hypothetical protein
MKVFLSLTYAVTYGVAASVHRQVSNGKKAKKPQIG